MSYEKETNNLSGLAFVLQKDKNWYGNTVELLA